MTIKEELKNFENLVKKVVRYDNKGTKNRKKKPSKKELDQVFRFNTKKGIIEIDEK